MPSVFPHAPLLIPNHFNISCCSWKFPFLKHHLFFPKATSLPTGVSQTEDSLKSFFLLLFLNWYSQKFLFQYNTCVGVYIYKFLNFLVWHTTLLLFVIRGQKDSGHSLLPAGVRGPVPPESSSWTSRSPNNRGATSHLPTAKCRGEF